MDDHLRLMETVFGDIPFSEVAILPPERPHVRPPLP
jgi:hypothetical protein